MVFASLLLAHQWDDLKASFVVSLYVICDLGKKKKKTEEETKEIVCNSDPNCSRTVFENRMNTSLENCQ